MEYELIRSVFNIVGHNVCNPANSLYEEVNDDTTCLPKGDKVMNSHIFPENDVRIENAHITPNDSGGGGSSLSNPTEDPSVAATIRPEECTEHINGDLNGDCSLSPYEVCLMDGNDQEVCDCVQEGGTIVDCADEDCNTSKEDLNEVFPNVSDSRLQEIADAINTHGQDFGIDSEEKLRHFLAQAGHESKNVVTGTEFEGLEENLNYRVNKLGIDYWVERFNPYTSYTEPPTTTINPDKENPNDYASQTSSVYVDNEKFANFIYCCRMGNGNEDSGDGYKYRGRGILQLTGKNNYLDFNTFYQNNYDNTADLVNNPDLVSSNIEVAVISALWFYSENVMNNENIDHNTSVKTVTLYVNGGENGLDDRKNIFNECEEKINCL